MSDLPNKADDGGNKPSKRGHDGQPKAAPGSEEASAAAASSSPIQAAFAYFRSELDEHHDRRERVIKASRDITAQSKKIIFTLQRHRSLNAAISPSLLTDITARKATIRGLLDSLIPDLTGTLNQARYSRQISPGLQELVEAAVFEEYLARQRLLTLSEARETLLPEPLRPALTETDFLLGIYDATGEIMRFAITGIATGGAVPISQPGTSTSSKSDELEASEVICEGESQLQTASRASASGRSVLSDLRELRAALEGLDLRAAPPGLARECDKKAEVMRASVEKVETAVYGLMVRGSERPPGWVPEARTDTGGQQREAIEGY